MGRLKLKFLQAETLGKWIPKKNFIRFFGMIWIPKYVFPIPATRDCTMSTWTQLTWNCVQVWIWICGPTSQGKEYVIADVGGFCVWLQKGKAEVFYSDTFLWKGLICECFFASCLAKQKHKKHEVDILVSFFFEKWWTHDPHLFNGDIVAGWLTTGIIDPLGSGTLSSPSSGLKTCDVFPWEQVVVWNHQ